MKNIYISILLMITGLQAYCQDSSILKIANWLTTNNFSIRKTFDGSKNEGKPASFLYRENHKTPNDFFNIDLGVKLSELEVLKHSSSSLIIYPKLEWHKSTDSTDLKNKLDGGVNFEFIPFGLKAADLPEGLPNKGAVIAPLFQATTSFKRNLIDKVSETKLAFQFSLVSNYNFLPGSSVRDKNDNLILRYYPYFGLEYYSSPDLISKGVTEKFSTYFIRLFAEVWIIPKTLQLNLDGTYRQIINNKSSIRTWLPLVSPSLYFYPGQQESFGIGYEYRHGYDSEAKYQLIQLSSLTLNIKI